MDADGSNVKRLTRSPRLDDYPVFSPDGRRIAFTSNRDRNFEIYVMNADGSEPRNRTRNPVKEFVSLFGSTPGRPEGEFQSSLPHALFFANSETVISWIEPGSGNLTQRLLKIEDTSKLIDEAYASVLSRGPTGEELKLAGEHLAKRPDNRRAVVIELVWSLVASAEFRLNH